MPQACRDCGHPVVLWRSPAGQWRRFATTPIPFRPQVAGLVAHRTRGLVDAGAVWPEPVEMLPAHRCPAYELAIALEPIAVDVAELVAALTPGPDPTPPARRKASAS